MILTEFIGVHMDITKSTKADACKRNNGPTDLTPMIVWLDQEEKMNVAVVEVKGNTLDFMPRVLAFMTQQNPKLVLFIAESLAKTADSPMEINEFLSTHKPGDLAKQYKSMGPLSGVEEIIAFNGIDMSTGSQAQGMILLSYDDWGQPIFSDPQVIEVPEEYIDAANMTWLFDNFYKFMKAQQAEMN